MRPLARLWLEANLVMGLRALALMLGWVVPGLWTYILVVIALHFVAFTLTNPPPKEPA